ncbi:putative dihydroflavonol 4-reductase [Rhodovastum atsumiense]|uniref:NAD-dependent epimerase/dehydratase family protein n=1 Tax=Rhodovastum atsumiense TaxID=504468 RepID=A0A5M6IJ59_9PROT|nr:hopanoid-associated sugar epimerase [Rhodovastum atsumiense]KAA5608172.1 NAD-dependent epimerase/dehydratase family protein [Rhodovastum atsumiense]CAH2600956.1 putative dihydroflavonol 4-reductase [Rhodovastum atsumiense]
MPATGPTLVTGATGFVGSAVARALAARGHALRLLARPGNDRSNLAGLTAEIVEGDLTQPESLARAVQGCRYVVHVAADYRIWVPDPEPMLAANVEGTRALLRAAKATGVERVVHCSSVAALGLTGNRTPADETTPVSEEAIVGIYKKSKYRAEQAVLELVRTEGVPAVIVNPTAPVGPRDIKPTPTGRMIADAAAGRMPAYVDTGLNIVHVDDVAEGHVLALERGRIGERYILGSENLTMAHILALVDDVTEAPQRRRRLPVHALWPVAIGAELWARRRGGEPLVTRDHLRMAQKIMFFSSAKAQAELGYRARPARHAIADAIAWFRANNRIPRA